MTEAPIISVVMPCLNEEETIGESIDKSWEGIKKTGYTGEVVVVDNGSSDGSIQIAETKGARVFSEARRGYGAAYLRGFQEARGRYIIMGDSDDTYDFRTLDQFINLLEEGYELVNGNRLGGRIVPGAMPALHRYVGVPFLSWFLNQLFGLRVSDAHCGLRAFRREILPLLKLISPGMEFASEMLVKAGLAHVKMAELPITYYPRRGDSKLRTLRDGLRHLSFMLRYAVELLIYRAKTFGHTHLPWIRER